MSKPASSPTARLLRSSRLFSLPRPLPIQPELSSGTYRNSDTATTPYPTHQAIATPSSSLHRGDWGLKRALPNKGGKKVGRASREKWVRVRGNDTYEHITDFASAGDVVMARRKWAAMEVPFVQGGKGARGRGEVSVFEGWLDNTDAEAMGESAAWEGRTRWKHSGPWLGGMQDGEFETFLRRTLEAPRKKEAWRELLRETGTEERVRKELAARRGEEWYGETTEGQSGLDGAQNELGSPQQKEDVRATLYLPIQQTELGSEQVKEELRASLRLTDDEVTSFEKELRDEHNGLDSRLAELICRFLDLPSLYADAPPGTSTRSAFTSAAAMGLLAADAESDGPPTTHPAAGLGHLRTNAVIFNHPLYGPQASKAPVEARVVQPRKKAGATLEFYAKLGVGGFVADDSMSGTSRSAGDVARSREERMVNALDEREPGGNKIWVVPETAQVDSASRIRMAVRRAVPEAVAVQTGVGVEQILEQKSGVKAPPSAALPPTGDAGMTGTRNARPPRIDPRIRGFEGEMKDEMGAMLKRS